MFRLSTLKVLFTILVGVSGMDADQFNKFNTTSLFSDYLTNFTFVNGSIPYPFAPPSAAYCESNELYDTAYVSIFATCNFTFYSSLPALDDHTCPSDDVLGPLVAIESRRVVLWPDSCVALGKRCYSIEDNPELFNYTFIAEDEIDTGNYYEGDFVTTPFPIDSGIVSVDCSLDYELAQEFMDHLPENLEQVAGAVVFFVVMIVAVVALCCGCLCCGLGTTLGALCCRPGRRGYQNLQTYNGPPVQARKYDGTPQYKAIVV